MAPPIYNKLIPTLDYNLMINNYKDNCKLNKFGSINNGNNFGCNKSIGSLVKCAFLCLLLFIVLTDASQNSIHVENNSYKDIVISFDPAISTNLVSTLLDNVEEKIQQISDHLFTATNQSLCFGEIIVLLPDHWSSKIGNRRLNTTRSFTPLDTDIYINSNGEMFNEEPFTDQFGQCGVGGKLIHLSKDVFLKKDNGNSDVKNILHQWAAYRYGVFSEHGFKNDKFHPDYTVDTSERLIMTSCASNVEGETMDIIVSPHSPSTDCFSRPLSDSFPPTNSCSLSITPSTIVSSLMFSPRLSSVSTFCSEDNHDAFSPTKQNRLCDGKSINEVIRSHPDFRGLQPNANKCNTKFTLVTEKRPRIAAFVDFVNDHDEQMILKPLFTFFEKYKPFILELRSEKATVLEQDDFVGGHSEDQPVCFDCAMEQLRGNVKNVDHSITHLYIVTAGHYKTERFPLESYAKELLSYDIKVKVVIYPYRPEANYSSLLRFAQAASAELFVVPHIDVKRPGSTYNRIAFMETLAFARDNFNPSELVVLSKNTTSETPNYSFKFNVDQSLIEANYSIKVVLMCHSHDSCTDKRVSHKVFINNVEVFYKAQRFGTYSNVYTLTAKPERHQDGEWEVKWDGLDPTKLSYITAIAIAPSNPVTNVPPKAPLLERNFFTGSCWLSNKQPIISPTSRDRVYAYVSLTKKLHEYVHNASVVIAFYDEFGALVSMAPMVDDGLGDPDITRGDGVWSYLLSDLPTRRFIRAEAIITSDRFTLYPGLMDRPCCGSSVPEQPVVQGYKDLNRVLSCGSFYIDDATDMFVRSSRTFDLSVSLVDETRYIVKVDFTLPTGVHSIEDIKIFNWTERPFIRSSYDSYGVRLSSVFEQGLNKYSKEFEIPKGTVTISGPYVIAALLKDPTGAKSLSNLVNIYLNGEPDLPSEPPESIMQTSDSDSSDFFDIINSAATGSGGFFAGSDGSGILGIWHVTFIVVGSFLFILVILLFIICLVAGRKRRGTDSGRHSNGSNGSINVKEEAKKIPPSSMGTENPDKSVYRSYSDGLMGVKGDDISDIGHHHIHSHHITSNHLTHQQSHIQQVPQSQQQQLSQPTYQNSSTINLDNGIKGISPVDSIPANKLLSHYDKVKQAKQRNEPLPVMRIEDITDIGSVHNASSLSDNDSRFRGSVTGLPDDPFVTMSNDLNSWRYPAPDQYQYVYTPHANYVPQNTNHLPNSVIEWRNSYDGSETISDYDPRYGTVDKHTTAVSQV